MKRLSPLLQKKYTEKRFINKKVFRIKKAKRIKKFFKKARFISRIRRRRVDLRNYEPIRRIKWRFMLRRKLSMLSKIHKTKLKKINARNAVLNGLLTELYNNEFTSAEQEIKTLAHVGIIMRLVLEFLLSGMLEMGKKIQPKKKNDVIQQFFFSIRNKHAMYNLNKILFGLRITITAVLKRLQYRKTAAINFAQQWNDGTTNTTFHPIERFAKNKFLVTWLKWIGGIITNFKRVAKRVISRMLNDRLNKKTEDSVDYFIAFPKGVPRLPALMINATENYWALNEGKRMGLATVQLIETSHRGFFGDCNLAINTHYLGLLIFTGILLETYNWQQHFEKLTHKQKLIQNLESRIKLKEIESRIKLKEIKSYDKFQQKLFKQPNYGIMLCLVYCLILLSIFATFSVVQLVTCVSLIPTILRLLLPIYENNDTVLKFTKTILLFFVKSRLFCLFLMFCINAQNKFFNQTSEMIRDSVIVISKTILIVECFLQTLIVMSVSVPYPELVLCVLALNSLFRAIINIGILFRSEDNC